MLTSFKQTNQKQTICFKKFSRKRFAVLSSLHREIKISALAVSCSILTLPGVAQKNDSIHSDKRIVLDEVSVSPIENSDLDIIVAPAVVTISSQTAQSSSQGDVAGLVKSHSGVDIRQRGGHGVQSDISYRGGTFDQTHVTLNNIPLTDPQTGHLSLFLPLSTSSIYKAEILSSTSSRYLGINSVGGTLNILTQPADTNATNIQLMYGSYNYFNGEITSNFTTGKTSHIVSAQYNQSDAYAENTDFNSKNIFYQGNVTLDPKSSIGIMLGYGTKAFGANGFYTPKYPNQFEFNEMGFGALSFRRKGITKISADIYYRRHKDRFELFRESLYPNGILSISTSDSVNWDTTYCSAYHNHHINTSYGAKFGITYSSDLGNSFINFHVKNNQIISNVIGEAIYDTLSVKGYDAKYTQMYQRVNADLIVGQQFVFSDFVFDVHSVINVNTEHPEKVNLLPGMNVQYRLNPNLGFTGSYAYSMGQPSFTDLFYRDPSNRGNRSLATYYMHVADLRTTYQTDRFTANVGVFAKYGNNVIDWVYFDNNKGFYPVHVKESVTKGIETSILYSLPTAVLKDIVIHYTYLDIDKASEYEFSKYNHLKHKMAVTVSGSPFRHFEYMINGEFQSRTGSYTGFDFDLNDYYTKGYEPLFLMNLKMTYRINKLKVFGIATNLFNNIYIDQGSIAQPGRWLKIGLSYLL